MPVSQIRTASHSDAQTLSELGRNTFIETFASDNSQEDVDLYVRKTFSAEKQLKEIQDRDRMIEIAWIGDQAAGYLHLLKGTPDPCVTGASPMEILRLYVDSRWHGKGVGAELMNKCIQLAAAGKFETLWLGVWENNFRAQAFYKKYGFEAVGQHIFRLGMDDQVDLIMVRKVCSGNKS